ncbi:MAG: amino-acid N-acetyltransferase [Gammaproteobacteria bacterium]|nr:amino-acid N-acetyltransferase [Gammaproteobacteria bacterium]
MGNAKNNNPFVQWFRNSAPYINTFRGKTFVIAFDGDAVADAHFTHLIHDIALLNSLGIRLVLVHGARPQIEQRLRERNVELNYVNGLRITDSVALACVKEAVSSVKVEIEALMSMGLANSPMAGARIRVASGNFVAARPLGIRDGVDYGHTGEVRRIDAEALQRYLHDGSIVLLSPLGYSPTGEVFNLSMLDVATSAAIALKAEKFICLVEAPGLRNKRKQVLRELSVNEAEQFLAAKTSVLDDDIALLKSAVRVCNNGTRRVHVIDRRVDGGLLQELFTRDGIGSLVNADVFEGMRQASIDDVGGILELIAPLEADGILVRRSRELLETEIDQFSVVERDGMIIGCGALYPYPNDNVGELAGLAVHPDYRDNGRGEALLSYLERRAKKIGVKRLFVLTTQTAHWFIERGFERADITALPVKKQALYNYQRRSQVYIKNL